MSMLLLFMNTTNLVFSSKRLLGCQPQIIIYFVIQFQSSFSILQQCTVHIYHVKEKQRTIVIHNSYQEKYFMSIFTTILMHMM